jgi:hypothetical protein
MDPNVIRPEWWEAIGRALIYLYLFVGLALTGAFAFLLAHATIPSLVTSAEAPGAALAFRRVLYPVCAAALALAGYALAQALHVAVDVLRQIYPRFWI